MSTTLKQAKPYAAKPKRLTVREVRDKFGLQVTTAVAALQSNQMGALIVSASGEALMLDYLRAAMPTKSGLIVGVIADPPKPEPARKPLTGQAANEALAVAREAALAFNRRQTTDTVALLQTALARLWGVL